MDGNLVKSMTNLVVGNMRDKQQMVCESRHSKRTQKVDNGRSAFIVSTYHGEAVADPERFPATGTVGHLYRLTVHCDHIGRDVTHHTATDVGNDVSLAHGHHRNGRCC